MLKRNGTTTLRLSMARKRNFSDRTYNYKSLFSDMFQQQYSQNKTIRTVYLEWKVWDNAGSLESPLSQTGKLSEEPDESDAKRIRLHVLSASSESESEDAADDDAHASNNRSAELETVRNELEERLMLPFHRGIKIVLGRDQYTKEQSGFDGKSPNPRLTRQHFKKCGIEEDWDVLERFKDEMVVPRRIKEIEKTYGRLWWRKYLTQLSMANSGAGKVVFGGCDLPEKMYGNACRKIKWLR